MSMGKRKSRFASELDDLQSLLEKQIEQGRRGNITAVEALGKQADTLVGRIAKRENLESGEFKSRRARLQKLYEELCLAVTAQKNDTSERLVRVRRGKRMVETYRSSI